jgi:hypothetical protein
LARKTSALKAVVPQPLIKLDIGCGKNKKEGFLGVDQYKLPGVDLVTDLNKAWPWKTGSVEEVNASHFIEHLTNLDGKWERVHFFNELYRILRVGGKASLVFPHWCSNRYYGDPTHKEPFSEMGFYYLSKDWRMSQAPHTDHTVAKGLYNCDFECTWGYSLHPSLLSRNQEFQQDAIAFKKEAAQDIIANLTKK